MSSSPVKLNPGSYYAFMDHTKGQIPTPPQPSQYAQGVPTHYHNQYPQKPQSLPGSQPPSPHGTPMYPPPQMVSSDSASSTSSTSSASSSRGIFTLYDYQQDRSRTPDLDKIMKKPPTWSGK